MSTRIHATFIALTLSCALSCSRTSAPPSQPAPIATASVTPRAAADATSGASSERRVAAPATPGAVANGPRRIPGWARVFGEGRMEGARSIVPAPDGGLFVAGTLGCPDGVGRQSSNPNAEDLVCDRAFVARYSRSGERAWMWEAAPGESNAESLALAEDGSLTLRGWFSGDVNFDPDASGATLRAPWTQQVGFTTHLGADGRHQRTERGRVVPNRVLATAPDGSMLVTELRNARVNGRSALVTVLAKVGADGRRAWTRSLDALPGSLVTQARMLADGSIYVAGGCGLGPGSGGTACFAKLDATGAVTWSRTLESEGSRVTEMAIARDGSLVVGGQAGSGDIDLDPGPGVDRQRGGARELVFVLRVRPDGERAWAYSFAATNQQLNGLAIGPDDVVTLLASGFGDVDFDGGPGTDRRTFADSLFYLVRLTPDGRYGGAIAMTSHPRMAPYGVRFSGTISASQMLIDPTGALLIAGRVGGTADLRFADSPPQRDVGNDQFDAIVARVDASAFTEAALAAERGR